MNKKGYLIIAIFAIIFTFFGGTLAYWQWNTSEAQRTAVNFTIEDNFSCSVDGGGDVSSTDKMLAPSSCTNEKYAIQRTITASANITGIDTNVSMDLWLDIKSIDPELSQSANFKYALTSNPSSCTEDVLESGTFNGKTANSTALILNDKIFTTSGSETYYLYIWLDTAETNSNTMDKTFNLSLNGNCVNVPVVKPTYTESILNGTDPTLEPGMIPITLSNTGVATVADTSQKWYNYENKQWANAVLVNELATDGVDGSHSRTYYMNNPGTKISSSDIIAYFVWIPRYAYKIPLVSCYDIYEGITQKFSGADEIENTINSVYPECYSMNLDSETDKQNLIQAIYYLAQQEGYTSYTIDNATEDVENGLTNNVFDAPELNIRDNPMINIIDTYNNMTSSNMNYTLEFHNEREVISKPAVNLGYLNNENFDITFESNAVEKKTGDAINTYITHPAFTFGDKEINGIWVGKFETTGTTEKLTILPNNTPLSGSNVYSNFTMGINFAGGNLSNGNVTFRGNNTYGMHNSTDSHVIKNSEWGSILYLAFSKYGINEHMRMNVSLTAITGCGNSSTVDQYATDECQMAYGTLSDGIYPQSTTGNITGIFDISGGLGSELVMAYYSNANSNYSSDPDSYFGWTSSSNIAGFTSKIQAKYWDEYITDSDFTACNNNKCYGHGTSELFGWNYTFVNTLKSFGTIFNSADKPWLLRGGWDGMPSDDLGDGIEFTRFTGSSSHFRVCAVRGT